MECIDDFCPSLCLRFLVFITMDLGMGWHLVRWYPDADWPWLVLRQVRHPVQFYFFLLAASATRILCCQRPWRYYLSNTHLRDRKRKMNLDRGRKKRSCCCAQFCNFCSHELSKIDHFQYHSIGDLRSHCDETVFRDIHFLSLRTIMAYLSVILSR